MKVAFEAIIKKFASQGEKTGWTYIEIPASFAAAMKPGTRKSFRVKGQLDNYKIEKASLLPMGEGNYILPLNKQLRSRIKKPLGAKIRVEITEDERELQIDHELIRCLKDEPSAWKSFNKLPPSHQRYYSKWITDAKTGETKARRIAKTVNAMLNNLSFGEMMKSPG